MDTLEFTKDMGLQSTRTEALNLGLATIPLLHEQSQAYSHKRLANTGSILLTTELRLCTVEASSERPCPNVRTPRLCAATFLSNPHNQGVLRESILQLAASIRGLSCQGAPAVNPGLDLSLRFG